MNSTVLRGLLEGILRSASSPTILAIVGIAVAFIVAGFLVRGLIRDNRPSYVLKPGLLTDNELDFVRHLRAICPKDWMICPQVSLSALVDVAEHVRERQAARNRYAQCFADFVVCRAETYEAVGIIELDDRSHNTARRRERDQKLDAIYQSIGLPVAHITARQTGKYTVKDAEAALDTIRRQNKAAIS